MPVIPAIAHRFLVPKVGVRFRDYYRDPEAMLRTQILCQKWLLENVRTDAHSIIDNEWPETDLDEIYGLIEGG